MSLEFTWFLYVLLFFVIIGGTLDRNIYLALFLIMFSLLFFCYDYNTIWIFSEDLTRKLFCHTTDIININRYFIIIEYNSSHFFLSFSNSFLFKEGSKDGWQRWYSMRPPPLLLVQYFVIEVYDVRACSLYKHTKWLYTWRYSSSFEITSNIEAHLKLVLCLKCRDSLALFNTILCF